MEFLESLFPNTCVSILKESLQNNDNNVDVVVEELLLYEFQERQELEPFPFETLLDMFPQTSFDEMHATWLKNNGDLNLCIEVLMDPSKEMAHLQKILSPKHIRQEQEDTLLMNVQESKKKQERHNQLMNLRELYPMHQDSLLQSALDASQNSLEKAACMIASSTLQDTKVIKTESHQLKLQQNINHLSLVFPQYSPSLLQEILQRYDSNVDAAMEYLISASNTQTQWSIQDLECNGDCINSGFPCLYHSNASRFTHSRSNYTKTKNVEWNASSSIYVSQYKNANTQSSIKSKNASNKSQSLHTRNVKIQNPRELRSKANELREIRNEFYRKACSAYKRSGITGRSTAAYYSQEGRRIHSEIERLDSEAVQSIISIHESTNDGNTIDLHGLTVKESMEYVARKIQEWSKTGSKRLKVITGVGRHSSNGSKLYPSMTRCNLYLFQPN